MFIEEVDERGYAIHRILEHLKQAGIFNNIKALILGDIQCQIEPNGSYLCDAAIKEFCDGLNFPIVKSTDFGHGKKNYPIIMGTKSTLILGKKASLILKNN